MEFKEQIEDLHERCFEKIEQPETAKNLAEDFFERLENEKTKTGVENSKAVAFGSSEEVKDSAKKLEKAKEEYNYRVKQLEKSLSNGEKSFNEAIDVKYAQKAIERAEIDLKYAKKNNH
ncbi:MAG: hypothetical protein AAGU76_11105 [Sedimentibacter sp.]|uniref:hypothetical protein n=1 Tax=Sedimentibacter sp. TaxID=1960295 RepID=UPI00315911DA